MPQSERLFAGEKLILEVKRVGGDLSLLLYGGVAPHVGAAALAQPYHSAASGRDTACVSVLSAYGHKDAVLAQRLAEQAVKAFGCTVSVVCGIHYDGLAHAQIDALMELATDMVDEQLHGGAL